MVSEEIAGTLDRKTLNEWKETKKSFIYKPKGRTFYYIKGKRYSLSKLKSTQIKQFGIKKKKYETALKISEIRKYYYQELKTKKLERKIKKKKIKKEKPERREQMYRLTVAINYTIRNKYYSMKLQKWSVTWVELKDNEERLKDELIKKLEKKLKFDKKDWWWGNVEPNVSIDEIDYVERLQGKEETTDEFLSSFTKRRGQENKLKRDGLDSPDWY